MQSVLNLRSSYGFPLCLSGITHPLFLSKQNIADHDRRREEMKKKKSQTREVLSADHVVRVRRNYENVLREMREGEIDGDLVGLKLDHQLLKNLIPCTAKAA